MVPDPLFDFELISTALAPKHGILTETLEDLVHPDFNEPIRVGLVTARTSASGQDTESIAECICSGVHSNEYHVIVAPEYSFLPKTGPMSRELKWAYVEEFRKASEDGVLVMPGTIVWQQNGIMHNTAYAFYNGKTLLEYDKNCDGGEEDIASKYGLTWQNGLRPGRFIWGGLNVGVEICADGGTINLAGVDDLDLIFLVSSGNTLLHVSMSALKQGGYGVLVDGFSGQYYAKQRREELDLYANFMYERGIDDLPPLEWIQSEVIDRNSSFKTLVHEKILKLAPKELIRSIVTERTMKYSDREYTRPAGFI